jgi:polar amino acid transport system substrate-binding protein
MGVRTVLGDPPVSATLRLACIDADAPPLFNASPDGIHRTGYEPAAADLVASVMGREVEWVITGWDNMIPMVQRGEVDAVWCGQGMIPERIALVDFTQPYAIFNETTLVRTGDPANSPTNMNGYKVGAIAGSANLKVAQSIVGAEIVEFTGPSVFEDMIDALRTGAVDAFVDDDVVMIPLADKDPDFVVAFTAETRNPWGVGVQKGNSELLGELNNALDTVIADGRLAKVWNDWMPNLSFPLGK